MESIYLERFKKYSADKKGQLFGESLIVEIIGDSERKSKGGIIMAESDHVRANFVMMKTTIGVILEVGEGYFDPDTNEDIPLKRKVGEVVWLSESNLRFCTTLPGFDEAIPEKKVAVISENHIYKAWDSIEEFKQDRELLNENSTT